MAKNYFGITDTGKRRTNNEDTFIAEKISKQFIAACVIDGLGGYAGGEVAAALARDAILTTLSKPAFDIPVLLKNAIIAANQSIQQEKEKNPDYSQMACVVTLALVDVNNNKFFYAHVGDTRLYLLRDKSLIKITKDQSFVGFLEDNGRLTEAEAMQHPKRNEINKALGFDSGVESDDYIEISDSPFLPGDLILVCSDGLTDMINSAAMAGILNNHTSLEQKAAALIEAANNAGGDDNITVVLVQNHKQQLKETAVKPAIQKKTPEEPAAANDSYDDTDPRSADMGKKRTIAVPVLAILLTCALVAVAWFYYQLKEKEQAETLTIPLTAIKRNSAEQVLSDSINQPLSRQFTIPAASSGQPIIVSDTIFINKDSLVIHGNGVTITSDSAFDGPAFVLADNCKYVVFDSLVFTNFNAAISVQRTGLYLKKVRFINCNIPVMQQFIFPDSTPVTGSIPRNLFKTDSLRK